MRWSADGPSVDPDVAVSRQLVALGDFVQDNLAFFLQFGAAAPPNGFLPPIDRTDIGAAAENRPVIGRWELDPDEALIVEVEPPEGIYWSFSLGNPWWETIHYGRHQSSLNAHQAVVDSDGLVRVVLCGRDPGVANWLDTAGHSNGPIILRCVRTETAPTPTARVVPFDDIHAELPPDTTKSHRRRARSPSSRRAAAPCAKGSHGDVLTPTSWKTAPVPQRVSTISGRPTTGRGSSASSMH